MSSPTGLLRPNVRPVALEERAAALRSVRQWSGYPDPDFLAGAYPHVFGPEADAELIGAFEDDRLVAHAALRRVVLVTSAGDQEATLVGTVITSPGDRGRGIGTELLARVVDRAEAEGRDALYLWSDQWAFYARLGFVPAGGQDELELRPRPGIVAAGLRPARACDVPEILALHRDKPLRVERSLHDQALMLSTRGLSTMVLEREGRVAAYACNGKGIDFPGWWHEVGGSDADVARLVLGAMVVLGQASATLLVPPYRPRLRESLRPFAAAGHAGVGALRRALTPLGRGEFFVDGLDSI
jgi:GNAT superfamily N-acetyltransferase